MFCPNCGYRNSEGVNYCMRCGASLIADQPDPQTTMSYSPGDSPEALQPLERGSPERATLVIRSGGGRAGETYALAAERTTIGRHPDSDVFLDDVTVSRNHAVVTREGDAYVISRPGQPQRHLRQPAAHRASDPARRRRAAGRQVQAHLHHAVSEKTELLFDIGDEKLMTIGAVVDRLKDEFPDISVSKLRYLEEQGLISPRRTKGGYRLFSRDDYQRLIRVLAMQRDEYLPLKVIRKETRAGAGRRAGPARGGLRKADFVPNPGGREGVHRRGAPAGSPGPTAACSPSSRSSSSSRAARSAACGATPSSTPASWRRPPSSPAPACGPRTCARSRARSTARAASSSRCSCRHCARAAPSSARRRSTPSRRSSRR